MIFVIILDYIRVLLMPLEDSYQYIEFAMTFIHFPNITVGSFCFNLPNHYFQAQMGMMECSG